jgi:sulfopyruvate decarboxylase TPP-binding subunit
MAVAEAIRASDLLEALRAQSVTDVVAVPDTHQRSLISLLEQVEDIRFIQAATEDEAVALAAGLIVGGRKPVVQIQHAGLYACVNHLRGIASDGRFPMVFLIGLLGRDTHRMPSEHASSMVRFAEPLLDTMEVPHWLLDGPGDLGMVAEAFAAAEERQGPTALLVGTNTA